MISLATSEFTLALIIWAIFLGCILSGAVLGVCLAMLLPGKPRPFYGDQITTDPDAGTVTREGRR